MFQIPFFLLMMTDFYCFPNANIFLAGLTYMPVQNLTIYSAHHDDIIPSLFELQSAKEINDIIQNVFVFESSINL